METQKHAYKIFYEWTHVQGHIATTKFNSYEVIAESEEEAIKLFSESDHVCAQYVKKDDKGWYYGTRDAFGRYYNKIIAKPSLTTYHGV